LIRFPAAPAGHMLRCRLRSRLDVALLHLRSSLDGRLAYDRLAVPGEINLIQIKKARPLMAGPLIAKQAY
jgi:hypothetical protein